MFYLEVRKRVILINALFKCLLAVLRILSIVRPLKSADA